MYNLQSGIHRQRFPARLTPAEAKKMRIQELQTEDAVMDLAAQGTPRYGKGQGKHKGAVTGIVVDSLNRVVISSGEDGKIKVCYKARLI